MKNNDEIPVFFTVDENYVPLMAVAICSLTAHASPARRYHIVVLHDNISPASQARIAALAQTNVAIEFREMQQSFHGITGRIGDCLRADYFTLTIYYRLFIPHMFPLWNRGIYMDCDMVLESDIAELYDTDLHGNLLAASVDHSIQHIPELTHYTDSAVGVPHDSYINSGILLMDLDKLRAAHLGPRFLELLNRYHFDCIAPDQDYLNALCYGKITFLGEEWDAMPKNYGKPLPHPKLIHYNLFAKPWCYDGVWYASRFWHYANLSGYGPWFRHHKATYSDEQKAKDAHSMGYLLERGVAIPLQGITFRSIFNTGKEPRL